VPNSTEKVTQSVSPPLPPRFLGCKRLFLPFLQEPPSLKQRRPMGPSPLKKKFCPFPASPSPQTAHDQRELEHDYNDASPSFPFAGSQTESEVRISRRRPSFPPLVFLFSENARLEEKTGRGSPLFLPLPPLPPLASRGKGAPPSPPFFSLCFFFPPPPKRKKSGLPSPLFFPSFAGKRVMGKIVNTRSRACLFSNCLQTDREMSASYSPSFPICLRLDRKDLHGLPSLSPLWSSLFLSRGCNRLWTLTDLLFFSFFIRL